MYEHQWQRIAKLHESALHMRMQCLMNLRLGHYCSKCKFESVHVIHAKSVPAQGVTIEKLLESTWTKYRKFVEHKGSINLS